MITKPHVQKRRIQKWLDGIGDGPTTNTLDKLPQPIANAILKASKLEANEEALLANHRGDAGWCLLTTKRLIWLEEKKLRAVPWNQITLAQQPTKQAAQVIRGDTAKDQVTALEVFEASGERHLLRLDAGNTYYIIWSAILAFCNLSRTPDRIPL